MHEYIAKIHTATNLIDLRDALNDFDDYLYDVESELKLEELIDITSLPIFSSDAPDSTLGAYSWDDSGILVYDNDWSINYIDR